MDFLQGVYLLLFSRVVLLHPSVLPYPQMFRSYLSGKAQFFGVKSSFCIGYAVLLKVFVPFSNLLFLGLLSCVHAVNSAWRGLTLLCACELEKIYWVRQFSRHLDDPAFPIFRCQARFLDLWKAEHCLIPLPVTQETECLNIFENLTWSMKKKCRNF